MFLICSNFMWRNDKEDLRLSTGFRFATLEVSNALFRFTPQACSSDLRYVLAHDEAS
jgi:hypothetical protein